MGLEKTWLKYLNRNHRKIEKVIDISFSASWAPEEVVFYKNTFRSRIFLEPNKLIPIGGSLKNFMWQIWDLETNSRLPRDFLRSYNSRSKAPRDRWMKNVRIFLWIRIVLARTGSRMTISVNSHLFNFFGSSMKHTRIMHRIMVHGIWHRIFKLPLSIFNPT